MSIGQFAGDDSPPLFSKVQDPPPSHWGKVTTKREESPEYLRFFFSVKADNIRNKEKSDGKRKS
jgi:hypothetical protein